MLRNAQLCLVSIISAFWSILPGFSDHQKQAHPPFPGSAHLKIRPPPSALPACRCARRGRLGGGWCHPWRAGGCAGNLERHRRTAFGRQPKEGVGQGRKDRLTLLHAGPRQGVLADEVISGSPVVIQHQKTQHGQLRHQQLEAQCLPPVRIKAWGGRRVNVGGDKGTDVVDFRGTCILGYFPCVLSLNWHSNLVRKLRL